MLESTAWRILAEEYDARRTKSRFLCVVLGFPEVGGFASPVIAEIPAPVRSGMIGRLRQAVGDDGVAYVDGQFDTDEEEREARVLACLMFAEESRQQTL